MQQVRSHEAWGFLPPVERSAHGYRLFTEHHLRALKTARALIAASYSWQIAADIMKAVHRGDMDTALVFVNARHAALHRERREIDTAVQLTQALAEHMPLPGSRQCYGSFLRVSAAARKVGVRPSALRFWEQQGLLQPQRDKRSGYRLYDQHQIHWLEIVAILRSANYSFEDIHVVLDELAQGRVESAMRTLERRRSDVAQASRLCAEATALLWQYTQLRALPEKKS